MKNIVVPLKGVNAIYLGKSKSEINNILLPEQPKTFNRGFKDNKYAELYIKSGYILEYLENELLGMIEIIEPTEIEFLGINIPSSNYQELERKFKDIDSDLIIDNSGFTSPKYLVGAFTEDEITDSNAQTNTFFVMSNEYFSDWRKGK